MLAGVLPALGIESLQKMGTTFLLCANALGGWCAELEARGKGKMADIQAELKANMLPGVTIVPAIGHRDRSGSGRRHRVQQAVAASARTTDADKLLELPGSRSRPSHALELDALFFGQL